MAVFPQQSVCEALEASLRSAKHLRARDKAAIAAARALAWKIDHWDELAERAIADVEGTKQRPAVPQNDNVSIASFLKYLDALGLTPAAADAKATRTASAGDRPKARRKTAMEEYMSEFG